MPETYGYVRTSRPRVSELAGSDPETQRQQLLAAGVALSHIYQDVGVSGIFGTNSRRRWHSLGPNHFARPPIRRIGGLLHLI